MRLPPIAAPSPPRTTAAPVLRDSSPSDPVDTAHVAGAVLPPLVVGPFVPRAQMVRQALKDLVDIGYTLEIGAHPRYRNPRAGTPQFEPTTIEKAATLLARPGKVDAADMIHAPSVVHLTKPGIPGETTSWRMRYHDLVYEEDALALAFFENRLSSDRLQAPAAAERSRDMMRRGYDLVGDAPGEYGFIGAYTALREGRRVEAHLGFSTVGHLDDPKWDGVRAFDEYLSPAIHSGLVASDAIDPLLDRLEQHADCGEAVVRLADALSKSVHAPIPNPPLRGAGSSRDPRTDELLKTWDTLEKLSPTIEPAAVDVFTRLLPRVGANDVETPAHYILHDMNAHAVTRSSTEERERVVWHLLDQGTPGHNLPRMTEALVRRPAGESLDERLDLVDRLSTACGHQDVTDDFAALQSLRPTGVSLREFSEPYVSLLSIANSHGEKAAASGAFVALTELARERGWDMETTVHAFVWAVLRGAHIDDALREVASRSTALPPANSGEVETRDGRMWISGIEIPVRSQT